MFKRIFILVLLVVIFDFIFVAILKKINFWENFNNDVYWRIKWAKFRLCKMPKSIDVQAFNPHQHPRQSTNQDIWILLHLKERPSRPLGAKHRRYVDEVLPSRTVALTMHLFLSPCPRFALRQRSAGGLR